MKEVNIEININGRTLGVLAILGVIIAGGVAANNVELASGYIDMANNEIINLAMQDNPAPTDAVNVQYLEEQTTDSQIQDLSDDSSNPTNLTVGRP
jgi:hypothetical protein